MRTQNIRLLGLTLIWAHNLFVLWAFGFPTVGGLILGRPKYASISSQNHSFAFSEYSLYFPSILPRIANPLSSFSLPIYRQGWVEELWLLLLLSANGDPIPSSQGGRLVGKVGVALELIPISAVCLVVTLLNARSGSWGRGTTGQHFSHPSLE